MEEEYRRECGDVEEEKQSEEKAWKQHKWLGNRNIEGLGWLECALSK